MKVTLRRYCWLLIACLAVNVALVLGWWVWRPQVEFGPFGQIYDQIKIGMTPEEVRGIAGRPALPASQVLEVLRAAAVRDEWDEADCKGHVTERTPDMPSEWWRDGRLAIEVTYSDGKVHDKSLNVRNATWDTPVWKRPGLGRSQTQRVQYAAKLQATIMSKLDREESPKARGRITLHSKDVPPTYFDGLLNR